MRQAYLLFTLSLLLYLPSCAQPTDTLYYNINWNETNPENALYYRTRPVKEDSLFVIKDYYLSGQLQMLAYSTSMDKDIFQGEVKRYDEKGRLEELVNYKNGQIEGDYIWYDTTGAVVSQCYYKQGQPFRGAVFNQDQHLGIKTTFKDGMVVAKEIYHLSKPNSLRIITSLVATEGDSVYQTKTYNYQGHFVGTGTYDSAIKEHEGVFPYLEPKSLSLNVKYFTDGKLDSAINHYSNGKPKERIKLRSYGKVAMFYKQDGSLLDSITFKNDQPFDGSIVEFNGDTPYSLQTYKNGVLHGAFFDTYYLHGVKRKGFYVNGKLDGDVTYYDKNDSIIGSGTYQNDSWQDGQFISRADKYVYMIYKEGQLVERRKYYPNWKDLAWREFVDSLHITYNRKGKEIARLVYKDNTKYEGKQYSFSPTHHIAQVKEYREGQLVKNEWFDEEKQLERSISYSTPRNYTEINYYPGGEKQSEITVENNGKRKITTVYFDEDGNEIGTLVEEGYDKNGDEYFFQHGAIYKMERFRNDSLIYKKRYAPNERLMYEVDFFGEANYYSPWGNLLASGTYRDGKPYDGTIYEYQNRDIKTIYHMKEGLLHGKKEDYEWSSALGRRIVVKEEYFENGLQEGTLKEFDANGSLIKAIPYKNNKENGEAVFYGPKGKVTGIYKEGLHHEGTFYRYSYNREVSEITSFQNGRPHGEWIKYNYDGDIDRLAHWENGMQLDETVYLNNKAYTVTYRDNFMENGIVPEYRTLKFFKNGVIYKKEIYANTEFEKLKETIEYNRPKASAVKTVYRSNGKKASIIHYVRDRRNGEATYYDEKGKLIITGTFKEDIPVHGGFIFYSNTSFDNYLRLRVEGHKVKAETHQTGKEPLHFNLTISDDLSQNAWLQNIESFLRNVESSCNYQYEIL